MDKDTSLELSIVIVNYNTRNLLVNCLNSIFQYKPKVKFKVYVVDNNSVDDSVEEVKNLFPQVTLIESNQNLGFARGNNLALKKEDSQYCLLLNSDTEVFEGTIDQLLEFAKLMDYGVSSCKLINPDGSFQHSGGDLPYIIPVLVWLTGMDDIFRKIKINLSSYHQLDEDYYKKREVGWIGGAAMLIKKEVFEKIGLFDNKIFMYGEDVDLCWRAKKGGFKIGWTDKAKIMHIGGASSCSPKLKQWVGEFKGLMYLYEKNYGTIASLLMRILFYLFIFIRALVFLLLGKLSFTKIYLYALTKI